MGEQNLRGHMHLCILVTVLLHPVLLSPVTEQDIALLSGQSEAPHCFTRTFSDLTCYWESDELENLKTDEASNSSYGFYYYYDGEPEKECSLDKQHSTHTIYVCPFPTDDVLMYNNLYLLIKDREKTLHSSKIEVENIGLIDYPEDIRAVWMSHSNTFWVNWKAPANEFKEFFKYQIQFWPTNTSEGHRQIVETEKCFVSLVGLQAGLRYYLRVRTKPNGVDSVDGYWGHWSDVITFLTPHSADEIELQCFTSDLSQMCCNWNKALNLHSSQQLLYKYGGQEWQRCEELINRTNCLCVFNVRNESAISVLLNISETQQVKKYYQPPFWMHHVVLPPTPEFTVKQLPGAKLEINWSIPLPDLEKDLVYQIRFSQDGNTLWKTLNVPPGAQHEVLDMVPGSHYTLQMRASPSGDRLQGLWSPWSSEIHIQQPSSNGWTIILAALSLLLVPGALICIRCMFPSVCRKLKDKLWPPLPNLHRVLDTFLNEMQKQYKQSSTLYEKPMEESPQSFCLEIVCAEAQHTSRDYVQLSPPTYHNEEYWPKQDLPVLSPALNSISKNHPASDIINQTYLHMGWNQ
ncbi:thrombopoietin receptor [Bombina bombina]|uniref:thrombopoietin receptor n=1 Tax=Bombina bombina TaxID=8345 RepID=UPI00235ADDC5|nr:thrombopoietin receptor [Bombina bombina]